MKMPDRIIDPLTANRWPWWRVRFVKKGPDTDPKTKAPKVRKSPVLPARLWWHEERDDDGELQADVVYVAQIDGHEVDPFRPMGWPWDMITEEEFDVLLLEREFSPGEDEMWWKQWLERREEPPNEEGEWWYE